MGDLPDFWGISIAPINQCFHQISSRSPNCKGYLPYKVHFSPENTALWEGALRKWAIFLIFGESQLLLSTNVFTKFHPDRPTGKGTFHTKCTFRLKIRLYGKGPLVSGRSSWFLGNLNCSYQPLFWPNFIQIAQLDRVPSIQSALFAWKYGSMGRGL